MKYLIIFLLVETCVTLTKCQNVNLFYIAASRIDDQVDFLERTILGSEVYNLDFYKMLKMEDLTENTKKRLMIMQKCVKKIKSHMTNGLKKHNVIMRRIIDMYGVNDEDANPNSENVEDLKKEYMRYLLKGKYFFLREIPAYMLQVSKELNMTFSDKELREAEKMLIPKQREGVEQLANMSKSLGIEESPFLMNY